MTKSEKVILGLKCHKAGFYEECLKCPFHDDGCETTLCNDAIALIEEQRDRIKGLIECATILSDALDEKEDGDD